MVVKTVYGQQKYMFENDVRSVPNRIVSLSMPQVRPVVRGKVVNNIEFGPYSVTSLIPLSLRMACRLGFLLRLTE